MTANESGRDRRSGAADPTGVPQETAAQLEELERLQQALAESEERAKNHWEQYVRAAAELDNVRKRAQRDIEAANRYGLEKFATELLPVRDSLELAVQNADRAADVRSLKQGHEAMLAQPSNTAEPNSVLQVVQPGYELNGRLLRPARVIVAKAP